ncbi:MAG: Hpt domain-containing protein [Proteobacteria bacterium]|nr:Hpt domain-containing protein [Pseudomonadota bacterium]
MSATPQDTRETPPNGGAKPCAVPAERIDILFRMGRLYLFLPFSALCIAAAFYRQYIPAWIALIPLLLQIATTIATREFSERYEKRDPDDDVMDWANRYVWYSGASGVAWGLGAFIWFIPGYFPAQAFLALAFMGMTAAEFIARSSYRPAYFAHAFFSLTPLIFLLTREGNVYASLAALLVLFFSGVLYGYCDSIAKLLDESIALRRTNADLVVSLAGERDAAEKAREVAEKSTRAKSAFIANVSHEIRTPLNALLGMAQLLDQSELDQRQKSHVKILLEAGRSLKTLLDDVIALSRDDSDVVPLSEDDCDAAQAARTVARMLQPRAWEKQINITVTTANNLPRVAADPRRVRQILLKLADNAVKFTERGGVEIRVDAQAGKDERLMLRFSVSDTGLGFTPDVAERLFEPFTPGDGSYARRNDGAGLGLAVAKRRVENLGGEIGFNSAVGEGAQFWFTIPALRAQEVPKFGAVALTADAAPPSGLTFLIALADEALRKPILDYLEPFGNRLIVTGALAEAIGRAGRENFDAIIVGAVDADMLAGAPGVRAPILALVSGGMRAPEAVGEVLRWPASASALYLALHELLGRGADLTQSMAPQSPATAAIDAPAFAALEKSLGLTTLIEILQSYMQTAESLCRDLSGASGQEQWDDAARIAQDIAGAAGGLGLAALTQAARGFTQKAREGSSSDNLREAADTVMDEHQRVCRALANLYPDLAA